MDRPKAEDSAQSATSIFAGWMPGRTSRKLRVAPDLTRCVVYARYSTIGQTEVSIERQVELCKGYAKATGRRVVDIYADRACSGSFTVGRTGLEAMVKAAKAGKFGILLVENVDRLARDLGILSNTFKLLSDIGVEMHQPGRGRLTLTDIAVQGLMGDEGRRLMAERSQYSRNAMAREGRVPGGACLGYAAVPGEPGVLVVDEAEASTVRRIFDMYLQGLSPMQICKVLAGEGFVYPRSGKVTYSGVKSTLTNVRYVGYVVYGRHHTKKDRDTAKTKVTLRSQEEWIVTEVPDLRIVDLHVWERAQALMRNRARPRSFKTAQHTSYMFTGLVACPRCKRTLTARVGTEATGGVRYVCSGKVKHGTCDFKGSINVRALEGLVLRLIGERLQAPGFVDAYMEAYNEELARTEQRHAKTRSTLERKVSNLRAMLMASFKRSLSKGFSSERTASMRGEIEGELTEAEQKLAAMPPRPQIVRMDRERLVFLRETIREVARQTPFRPSDEPGMLLVAAIREVVARIEVSGIERERFEVSVRLRIASLVEGVGKHADRFGDIVLTGAYQAPSRRYADSDKCQVDADRYAAGEFRLSTDDWNAIAPLLSVRRYRGALRCPSTRRAVVDALIYVALTGSTWESVPCASNNGRKEYYPSALRLMEVGVWDRIRRVLGERDPARYAGLLRCTDAHGEGSTHEGISATA